MTIIDRRQEPWQQEDSERRQRRAALMAAAAFLGLIAVLWLWWPAGVVLGLAAGVAAVARMGRRMHAEAEEALIADALSIDEDELWQEFRRLRVRLGDDWPAFRRAALVVTRQQSASSAVLRRELGVTTADAQHLLQLLETEGFVGEARGTQPRQVRVARGHAESLEELLEA
ncbi:DNA translocase FtsK [Amnibacterium endophyticum]|uniref:DNA translocase FtsK n=1 Tax=Amnibacterium endophyticum TaxID=2109337 RepID=A0ABW4LCL8_9MICO